MKPRPSEVCAPEESSLGKTSPWKAFPLRIDPTEQGSPDHFHIDSPKRKDCFSWKRKLSGLEEDIFFYIFSWRQPGEGFVGLLAIQEGTRPAAWLDQPKYFCSELSWLQNWEGKLKKNLSPSPYKSAALSCALSPNHTALPILLVSLPKYSPFNKKTA